MNPTDREKREDDKMTLSKPTKSGYKIFFYVTAGKDAFIVTANSIFYLTWIYV